MLGLCKYSKIFGEPNVGAHAQRIYGFALTDIVLTLVAAYIISSMTHSPTDISAFFMTTLVLLILAIILHELFCVNTRLNSIIFDRPWDHGS